MEGPPSPSAAKWSDVFTVCITITAAARNAVVRVDDCRIVSRLIRKVHLLLQELLEENPEQDYASVDVAGCVLSSLRELLLLVTRCSCMGRLQNFLESAAIRQEMKSAVEELHGAMCRMEQDHLKVPDDVAEDLRVLAMQLQRVEFTVFPEREAMADQLFSSILLERAGLAHDTHIVKLLKDIASKCGISWCDSRLVREELSALEARAAVLHEESDHIQELLLSKVASLVREELLSKRTTGSIGASSPDEDPQRKPSVLPINTHPPPSTHLSSSAPFPLYRNFDITASITLDSKSPHSPNKAHVRRSSFGAISALHPIPSIKTSPASRGAPDDACSGSPISIADSAESLEARQGKEERDVTCVTCNHMVGADNLMLDADDLSSLVLSLMSDNVIAMQTAAHAIGHLIVTDEFDWGGLEGSRMKLIRPLINILRYRHPLSLKSTAAMVLRYLARQKANRQAIADAGGIVLLMKLFKSHSDTARQAAARAISNILCNMDALKVEVMKAGIVDLLNTMMEALHPGTQEAAAVVLANLGYNNAALQKQIVEAGSVQLLVGILRDGSASGRQAAARALRNLTKSNSEAKSIALNSGAVGLLVDMMDEKSMLARQAAANALSNLLLNHPKAQACVLSEGVVPLLVDLLSDVHMEVREAAAWALSNLATTDACRTAIVEHNGVPALVEVMRAAPPTAGLAAASALKHLVACNLKPVKRAVAVSGALPLLSAMLAGDNPAVQKVAAGTLWNLAYKNEENRTAISQAGAIPLLVRLLKSFQAEGTRLEAARAISNLSCNNTANQMAIAAAGAILPLVHLLQSGSIVSKEAAARALSNLALLDDNQEDITRSGAIVPLLTLMQSTNDSCREAAARAYGNIIVNNQQESVVNTASMAIPILKNLMMEDKQRTIQLEAARAVGNLACVSDDVQTAISGSGVLAVLIKMLDSGHDATREAAACALWDIAYDNDTCRLEIVAMNGIPYLVQALLFGSAGTKEAAASTLAELASIAQHSAGRGGSSSSSSIAGTAAASGSGSAASKRRVSGEVVIQVDPDDGPSRSSSVSTTTSPCCYCTCHTAAQGDSTAPVHLHITPAMVHQQIVDAGAVPLLIQLQAADDAKLRAVGERALQVMGYGEDIKLRDFPHVSAYHNTQPLLPRVAA